MKDKKQERSRKDFFLELPISQWRDVVENKGHSQNSLLQIAVELSDGFERQALAFTYFSQRGRGKSHEQAVRAANRALVKARKMIGYSYPESGMIHF